MAGFYIFLFMGHCKWGDSWRGLMKHRQHTFFWPWLPQCRLPAPREGGLWRYGSGTAATVRVGLTLPCPGHSSMRPVRGVTSSPSMGAWVLDCWFIPHSACGYYGFCRQELLGIKLKLVGMKWVLLTIWEAAIEVHLFAVLQSCQGGQRISLRSG